MTPRDDITDRAQARVGQVLKGKWRLDAVLGIGGMASVYSATHRNRSRAAIKMLHPEVALSQDVTSRFLREGYVGNAVAHPGTVRVLDDDVTEDGAPFLVMELLEGESLGARLDRDGPLPPLSVAELGFQLLDVMTAAHGAHIVHRDLKPDNVFLTHDGRVKVLDFGIARLRERANETSASTQAGSLLGTPAFMAPEQALGRWKDVDERTDIWAIGATLFTLLTGRFVHEADTVQEQLVLAATSKAPPVRVYRPDTPVWLANVVDRALSFGRDLRYPDARSMQVDLRTTAVGIELSSYPASGRTPVAYLGSGMTPAGLIATPAAGRVATSPSLTEGATIAAASGSAPGQPSANGLASVQAVARSAQEPPPRSRTARLWLPLSALALVVVGAAAAAWLMRTPAISSDGAAPRSAAVLASPAPSPVAKSLPAARSEPPSAPSATKPVAPKVAIAPKTLPVAKAETGAARPRPALFVMPPPLTGKPEVSKPSDTGKSLVSQPPRQENLFDNRH